MKQQSNKKENSTLLKFRKYLLLILKLLEKIHLSKFTLIFIELMQWVIFLLYLVSNKIIDSYFFK